MRTTRYILSSSEKSHETANLPKNLLHSVIIIMYILDDLSLHGRLGTRGGRETRAWWPVLMLSSSSLGLGALGLCLLRAEGLTSYAA